MKQKIILHQECFIIDLFKNKLKRKENPHINGYNETVGRLRFANEENKKKEEKLN